MGRSSKWWVAGLFAGWVFAQPVGPLDALGCRPDGGRLVCGADAVVAGTLPSNSSAGSWSESDLMDALARTAVDPSAWFDVGVLEFTLGRAAESAAAFEFADASLAARVNQGVAWVLARDGRGEAAFDVLMMELTDRVFVGGLYGGAEPLVTERWDVVTREVVWRFAAAALRARREAWAFDLLSSFPDGEELVPLWRDAKLFAGWVVLPASDFVRVVRGTNLSAWEEALWVGRAFARAGNTQYAIPQYEVVEELALSAAFEGVAHVLAEASRFWLVAGDAPRAVRVAEVAADRDGLSSRSVVASLAVAQHANGDFMNAADSYRAAIGFPDGNAAFDAARLRFLLAFALEGAGDPEAVEVTVNLLRDPLSWTLSELEAVRLAVLRAGHLRDVRAVRDWSREEESEVGSLLARVLSFLTELSVEELLVLADVADERLAMTFLTTASMREPDSFRVRSRLLRQWWNAEQWSILRDSLVSWLAVEDVPEWWVLLGGASVMLDDFELAEAAWVKATEAGVPGASGLLSTLRGE